MAQTAVVYSREIDDKTYTFEASGALLNASLVMQDKETDSYWSIMTEEAVYGEAKGKKLELLPGATKTTWGIWKIKHPNSLVLSYGGREHDPADSYLSYFRSNRGFRGIQTKDDRLANKVMIYSFHRSGAPQAIPHKSFIDGGVVRIKDRALFLFREEQDSFYQATTVFLAPVGAKFNKKGRQWTLERDQKGPLIWDPAIRAFSPNGGDVLESFQGFDTYWYIWSLTNKNTNIMEARQP